ncbi:LIM domain only protein 7b isoform X4 [Sinocyclocheilus rhinocerous]|uniref:LIM domain only protein 7b isoform X4 n=1 Tax=Sinocyclocheilus rhinocerous TaxID=307959 RepID=UPI0007B88AE7|nr:PREDICTED: LIM domain only protein 7-like isoform X4 [Sinocyclocheilus rhinocerous]
MSLFFGVIGEVMEWRQQSAVSCELAFQEAQRWLEEVTKKRFGSKSFRVALEDGVLLCDLINTLKPGIIKRVNRLSTPIAGLDNVNVFLKACEKLGLNEAQLFHPGDLQDVSTRVTVRREETSRRLKNVLITIYWLGRKAQSDPFYTGPQLNLKAFEGLLGTALSKALEESVQSKSSVRDSGYAEGWFSDREDLFSLKQSGYRREDSVESLDSVESRTLSVASDCTLRVGSEGCCSDAEAEHCFRMAEGSKSDALIRERVHVPSALRKKRQEYQQGGRSYAGNLTRSKSVGDITLEPIPQESDTCSSFDQMGSRHIHQRSVGEVTLDPSAIQRIQQEQLQSIRDRIKESEAKWHEDLNRWKSRRRSANSDLHKKREEREQTELITSGGGASAIRTAQLTGVPEESSNMPGPMSDAGSSVSSTGWSTTSTLPLTNGTSALTRGTDADTTDSAGEFFSPPSAVVSEQSSLTSLATMDPEPYEQQGPDFSCRASLLESFYAGGARVSATLPRGFRRSEGSSRLSTGVTPRPFGAKPSKVSSLPRVYSMDDSHKSLISGNRDHSIIPSFLSGQGKVTASADTGHFRSSTHPIKKEEEERRDGRLSAPPINSFVTKVTMAASNIQTTLPAVSEIRDIKVGQSEMRVCLNQKPNSGRDFGFKAHWDSTGACVKSVQPGSPAELCGLLMGDEIVALGGCRVAEMNYEQFKGSMNTAQQKGTLLMDIRRHGQNDWGSDQPFLPYKSHKTINLTSANSTLIGRPEQYVSINTTSPVETMVKTQVNGQPANGVLPKMVNGRIQDNPVPLRNKGGSESAISDLQVPSISTTSSRWSWDHEEERRRQEKWQMEQERLLQEKYRRDQEKLEEEWRRAQQEVYGEEHSGTEEQKCTDVLSNGNATYIPSPFFNQSIATTSVASKQNAEKVEATQNRQSSVQTAAAQQSLKAEVECDSTTKSQCSEESYGFAKLTVSDRTKSKSTPALQGLHKQDAKGSGKKKGQLSQAEKERLQILEEMRKKTQLLTDNSWIRQRNASINKEPVTVGTSIRRYESLDNLHSTNSSWSRQSYTSSVANRPHSALGNPGTYRSGRSSLGPDSAIFSTGLKQSSNSPTPPITTMPEPSVPKSRPNSQQRGRRISLYLTFNPSVSAAGLTLGEGLSPELRSESDTDSSSVTPATAESESVPPSPSNQNALQQIEEECTTEAASGITTISTT